MSHEVARRTARLFAAAILLVFVLGLPALASAQSSYQVRFAKAENTIRTHEPTITWWEQQSKITLGIGLTIVVLGIATGVLQALTKPWTRPATLIVGALVTALTAVNTTFFDGDYKTLRGRANEGRSLIAQADTFIKLAPSLVTDSDREDALGIIQESAKSLAQLVGGGAKGLPVAQTPQSTWAMPSVFATVFAAGGACGCDALRQQDTDAYRYFCGAGTAKSLSEARKSATENALAQASGTLQRSQSEAGGDLTSYLRSVSSEVAACPASGPKGFTMFVLLRVPSTLTTANAQQAFVRPMAARPRMRLKLDKIRVIQDGSTSTTGWLFEVRAGGKSFSLPDKNYSDRPKQNEFVPAAADAAVLDVEVDSKLPLRIEVLGRRSFGGDTATGAQAIATGSPTTIVNVRNATSPNKGSFEFTFSTTRVEAVSR
jgi:hypothetical protein